MVLLSSLKVGIIGSGCIGIEHLNNAALIPNLDVVAIADNHPPSLRCAKRTVEKLKLTHQVTLCDDFQDLLKVKNLDAVIICTPNDTHHDVLKHVLETRKHVLVEKPLCTTAAHCVAVETAASKLHIQGLSKPLLWCGMEYRYIPAVARLIREAHSGAIGELRMLSIREHRFPFLRKIGNWNRFNDRTGGTLVEKCVHFFDLIRFIMRAEPTRIFASGGQSMNHLDETDSGRTPDILDNAYVIVDLDTGGRAMLELCMFAEASKHQEELSLVGTHGKLEAFAPSHGARTDDESVVNFRRTLRDPSNAQGVYDRVDPPPPEECGTLFESHEQIDSRLMDAGNHAGATYYELERFTTAALEGLPPDVSLRDGSMAVMMGIAAQRSIELGVPVSWSEMLHEYKLHSDESLSESVKTSDSVKTSFAFQRKYKKSKEEGLASKDEGLAY